MRIRWIAACLLLTLLPQPLNPATSAQTAVNSEIAVTESAGMRRTEYPVRAQVALARGAVTDPARFQLRTNNTAVAAQYAVATKWPDGSVQAVDIAFNVSLNPGETRTYQLAYGSGAAGAAVAPRGGLAVTEAADGVQIGTVKFSPTGTPLIASATYVRADFIGTFADARNGFSVTDKAGTRRDLSSARDLKVELVERGPLLGVLKYSGVLALDGSVTVPFTLTIEMPNSKSWVKMTATITDAPRQVRDLAIDTPLALGAMPWQWDISTENQSYGAFRNATDAMTFSQVIPDATQAASWKIDAGTPTDLRPMEGSVAPKPATSRVALPAFRSGHLQSGTQVLAFAIDRMTEAPGTYTVSLDGRGQATYRFAPAPGATAHRLVVYQHFVSAPVAIGAATSPASMVQPPLVVVK